MAWSLENLEARLKGASEAVRDSVDDALSHILKRLDRIAVAVEAQSPRDELVRRFVNLSALEPEKTIIEVRPGWEFSFSRVTVICDAAADVELFAGGRSDYNLAFRTSQAGAARVVSDLGGTAVGVPDTGRLIAALTAGAANCTVAVWGVLTKSEVGAE